MTQPTHDIIRDVASPEDLVRILLSAAHEYAQDAENLRASHQDPQAGAIWDFTASLLEIAANKIEKKWAKT